MIPQFKDAADIEELVRLRREAGYKLYAVEVSGNKVDRALFRDTSWEALEQCADTIIWLRFEMSKASTAGQTNEVRKLGSLVHAQEEIARSIFEYRERMKSKAPQLLTETQI